LFLLIPHLKAFILLTLVQQKVLVLGVLYLHELSFDLPFLIGIFEVFEPVVYIEYAADYYCGAKYYEQE